MRELKFRAWAKPRKEMREITDDWFIGDMKQKDFIVMQYTGLRDKNGRDIYEGDILMIEDYYSDYQDGIAINRLPDNRIEQVQWSPEAMWQTDNETLVEVCTISEIIGNIYEHKDLLK